jgi:hypothetical protein
LLFLVQPGDFLEVRDGGVYSIASVASATQLQLGPALSATPTAYETSLSITTPTMNYRILRQPRILIGEPPLQLPNNLAVDMTQPQFNSINATTSQNIDILFSPSGAVVGANAGMGKIFLFIHDATQIPLDTTKAAIVAVQCNTGFIGAYSVAPGPDPLYYAEEGRSSGL